MTRQLVRHNGHGHLHFVTLSCHRRLALARAVRTRNVFVKTLDEVRDRYGFSLVGCVVMPEHIHLLVSEPRHGPASTMLQVLKHRVPRRLRLQQRASPCHLTFHFQGQEDSLLRFWQRRLYDFSVWRLKNVEKLHYMHMNPFKGKLFDHPKDWPLSSFSFYSKIKQGLIRIDPVN